MVARQRAWSRVSGRALAVLVVAALLAGGAFWYRRAEVAGPPPAPNYDDAAAWLCRPGRLDSCARPTTASVFETETRRTIKTFSPDPAAPIDCFYVYPTVSKAAGVSAPIAATGQETGIVREQFAPFSSVCRPFAPLYRQVTRGGLKKLFKGEAEAERELAYADVLAAWRHYLANDNAGRGFVLIGHSQGARILARLVAEEIDGKPIASKLVSSITVGTRIDVPEGKVLGGTYRHVPLCETKTQTGCVIAYSSYLAARKMSEDSFFGATNTPGLRNACVSPMSLAGATSLEGALPVEGEMRKKLGTDFSELPGLIAATCRWDGRFNVLAVGATPGSGDAERTEAMLARLSNPTWGLHSLDVDIALGTLLDLVRGQAVAYGRPRE